MEAEKQATRKRAAQLAALSTYQTRLINALNHCTMLCLFCASKNVKCSTKHQISQCPTLVNTGLKDSYHDLGNLRYTKGKRPNICFLCHVPQYNDHIHPWNARNPVDKTNKTDRTSCTYFDIILPACFIVYHTLAYKQKAEKHFGQYWSTIEELALWIADRTPLVLCKAYASNGEALFMWYQEQYISDL
jgi:hypothetical protein